MIITYHVLGFEYETPGGKRMLDHAGNLCRGYVTTKHKALSTNVKDLAVEICGSYI